MDAKDAARAAIERANDALVGLSHRLHEHPELGFEEERACDWVGSLLADHGFDVETGVATVADEVGITVKVLGTPAEEGGGGKILMLDRGAFAGIHAAMMVHPAPDEHLDPPTLAVAH